MGQPAIRVTHVFRKKMMDHVFPTTANVILSVRHVHHVLPVSRTKSNKIVVRSKIRIHKEEIVMKVIRNITAQEAYEKLEQTADQKFVATEMSSGCLCRCSDG